jgi:hypothetical protein
VELIKKNLNSKTGVKVRYALLRSVSQFFAARALTLKIKINGRCVNKCAFCPFHDDPHLLEVKALAQFFDFVGKHRFLAIVINGGEPTIHPRFVEICDYLKDRFNNESLLVLGTNLIPLASRSQRYRRIYEQILRTYDCIEVGCDDEHKNIHLVERFVPEILEGGLKVTINAVADYCSEATRERILAVKDRFGVKVVFSKVHHYYESLETINKITLPCTKQFRDLLLNCNGDVFFCYHQEMENPLFNLFTVTREEFHHHVYKQKLAPYRFCGCCPVYVPQYSLFRCRGPVYPVDCKMGTDQ